MSSHPYNDETSTGIVSTREVDMSLVARDIKSLDVVTGTNTSNEQKKCSDRVHVDHKHAEEELVLWSRRVVPEEEENGLQTTSVHQSDESSEEHHVVSVESYPLTTTRDILCARVTVLEYELASILLAVEIWRSMQQSTILENHRATCRVSSSVRIQGTLPA